MKLSCHCGNVKIHVGEPRELTQCNCSICSRYMSLWAYFKPHEPELEIGDSGTESYAWGDRELDFIRCSGCGCITHYKTGQPNPKIAINFRMAAYKEIQHIPIRNFNGAEEL